MGGAPLALLFVLALVTHASSLGALPGGCFTAYPDINIMVGGSGARGSGGGTLVYCVSITICSTNGTSYNFTGQYKNAPSQPAPIFTVTFEGSAVCSTNDGSIILTVDDSTVSQSGAPYPVFKSSAAPLYAGEFHYGVSANSGGTLIINKWSGSNLPILFVCSSTPCSYSLACNTTVVSQFFVSLVGGNLTASNSFVTLASNSTSVFEGNEITITDSTQVTLQQSSTMNQTTVTVEGDSNTFNFSAPSSTFYQFITAPPASCRNFAELDASRATNISINSVSYTRVQFTSSSLDAPGGDWSLTPDSSTLEYDGTDSYGYILQGCILSGELYNPSAVGQRIILALYNVTTGTPTQIASASSTSQPSNSTNPTFITAVCVQALVSNVYPTNRFGIYAALEHTDGTSAVGLLGLSTYALYAVPMACKGSSININISANFNGTQLEAGTCMSKDNPDPDTVRLNNIGVCGVVVTDAEETPAKVEHETFWQHAWHRIKEVALGSTSTLAGTITLIDTVKGATSDLNTMFRHTTGNNIELRVTGLCPIDCGDEPIETEGECTCGEGMTSEGPISTNDTCTCSQGVESEGPISTPDTCTCTSGVTASNGTCNCENGVETSGECTCTAGMNSQGPVTAPSCTCTQMSTTIIESPDHLPIQMPDGVTFQPRTPRTITFDPTQNSISSTSTSTSSTGPSSSSSGSSSSGLPSSGTPNLPGLPGGGGCGPASLLLKPGMALEGIDAKTGKKVKIKGYLLGSLAHAATHAATSAAGDATSAAGSATGAATAVASAAVSVLTGILCHGGGTPIDPTTGLPTSGLPSGDPLNDPVSITGPLAAAAFSGSTPSSTATPSDPTTLSAALAAASFAVSSGQLPPNGPTSIVLNGGGLQVPVFNNSQPMPTCGTADRGDLGVVLGNGTSDDRVVMCIDKPTLGGFAYYEIPTAEAVVSAVFSGNGTGLVCLEEDNWCDITSFPNGTLFAIRPRPKITPGSCTFCSLTWNEYGELTQATSGNITLYNGTISYVNESILMTNSLLTGDNETAWVNQGYTVLNQVLIEDLNITGTLGREIETPPPFSSPFIVSPNCTGEQLCEVRMDAGACNWGIADPCQVQVEHDLLTTNSLARVSVSKGVMLAPPSVLDYSTGSLRIAFTCGGNTLCFGTASGAMSLLLEIMRY